MAKEKAQKKPSKKRSAKPRPAAHAVPPEKAADEPEGAFNPDVLESTIIALPLLDKLKEEGTDKAYDIIIDVNRDYPGGRDQAQQRIRDLIADLIKRHTASIRRSRGCMPARRT